jgi:phosphoglucomutase/phosphopentomutase
LSFFLRNAISDPDPTFPTVPFPNPEEGKSALNLSMSTVEKYNTENAEDIKNGIKGKSIHILANDPDADRLAVAEYSER